MTPALTYTVEDIITTVKELMVEKPIGSKEAADYLDILPDTLYKQIADGSFPAKYVHKFNGRHKFFYSELRDLIKSL